MADRAGAVCENLISKNVVMGKFRCPINCLLLLDGPCSVCFFGGRCGGAVNVSFERCDVVTCHHVAGSMSLPAWVLGLGQSQGLDRVCAGFATLSWDHNTSDVVELAGL